MRLSVAAAVATFCSSILLYPLFEGGSWFWGTLGAVLAVLAASLLSGRLSLPAWAATLVSLLALWIYLTASFASDKAWALVLPTRASAVELARLLAAGWDDIQRFAAPVPANTAITLLTCGGVGLIALLVDLLAARTRRAALAGLPLLALVTVPATILSDPIGWPAFVIAASGFLGLLMADGRERVGHWGRAVLVRRTTRAAAPQAQAQAPVRVRETADTRGLRLSGKRIGFAAVVIAVLVPAALPVMEPVSFFTFGVGGRGPGAGNSISIANPIASLRGQLNLPEQRVVLSYTNSDDKPRYLRIYALDTFDGEQFGMTDPEGSPDNRTENGPLPPPPGLQPGVPVANVVSDIQISDEIAKLSFLPLPYPPRQVRVDGDWRADVDTLMVFSTREEAAAGLEYKVSSSEPVPTSALLRSLPRSTAGVDARYLRLPDNLPPKIRELAQEITKGARTHYDAAVKLQEFFTKTGNFTYSLQTQGHGNSALEDFLLHSRAGYCEQFAMSMAVLARLTGIPARVAIGYTGGTKTGDRWTVGTNDSHSWPELYFEGVGWLPFEPTPAGSLGQGSARVPAYTVPPPDPVGDSSTPSPGATSSSADEPLSPQARQNPRQLDREATLQTGVLPAEESTPLAAQLGIGAGVLLLLLLVPAGLRLLARGRRLRRLGRAGGASDGSSRADSGAGAGAGTGAAAGTGMSAGARAGSGRLPSVAAVWAELDDLLLDYGLERGTSETPRALARRLAERYEFDAGSAAAITAIASAVERSLFARSPGEIGPVRQDLRTVRKALAATASRGRRLRALLLPPSTLRRIRLMGERLLDGFDRLENLRLRRTAAEKGS
ncbi:transglutaminaseTgpA domain-containing protein [Nonomuraea sp. NPDC050383]|uniref:transglutaminase family protein n=1 Tax=Nonomuraea sp. NPDC050383 TaxID=3364362 RepID=UPI003788BE8A